MLTERVVSFAIGSAGVVLLLLAPASCGHRPGVRGGAAVVAVGACAQDGTKDATSGGSDRSQEARQRALLAFAAEVAAGAGPHVSQMKDVLSAALLHHYETGRWPSGKSTLMDFAQQRGLKTNMSDVDEVSFADSESSPLIEVSFIYRIPPDRTPVRAAARLPREAVCRIEEQMDEVRRGTGEALPPARGTVPAPHKP